MKNPDAGKNNGTLTTRIVCAVVFCLFSFCWLYFFQADVIAVAQHVLSGGVTTYDKTVGAVLITLALQFLQLLVFAVTRLARRTHALTYFPSMMALGWLSSSLECPDAWWWAAPVAFLAWAFAVWLSRQLLPFENDTKHPTGFFSRRTWLNVLQMTAMMVGVALVANSNAVYHFRAHAESALMEGDNDEALRVGGRSLETDVSLTMLRIFALARQNQIGERLFSYPVRGTSADMLPLRGSRSRLLMMPDTLIWDCLGRRPDSLMTVRQYIDSLERDTTTIGLIGTDSVVFRIVRGDTLLGEKPLIYRDYRLAGFLLDRRLDDFADCLPRYYELNTEALPRHYREALVLYQQLRDTIVLADSSTTTRYKEYRQQDSIYRQPQERHLRNEDLYGDTYWYYYDKRW